MKVLIDKFIWLSIFLIGPALSAQWTDREEKGDSRSYQELISAYQWLAENHSQARLDNVGKTDAGKALHLFLIGNNLPEKGDCVAFNERLVILINNGIHAGESCGMDASVEWARSLLEQKTIKDDVIIAIVPAYNIGGLLQARPFTRANQKGPNKQGFRGNARNLDLNRDFVKADAQNTLSFFNIYTCWKPQVFIDTHTSNGADYPYTMTLISTQSDKIAPPIAQLMEDKITPLLYEGMERRDWPMTPYVNVFGRTPNTGMSAFLETPRYASGFTALRHSLSYITEAHMLKAYEDRLDATRAFLEELLEVCTKHQDLIVQGFEAARSWDSSTEYLPIQWELDSSRVDTMPFRSFEYDYIPSDLGNYNRLKYSQVEKLIDLPYYSHYLATDSVLRPRYYVLPAAWTDVTLRLKALGVKMKSLGRDSTIEVESSFIRNPQFSSRPYEGRFMVSDFELETKMEKRLFYRGDYLIDLNENSAFLLVSLLEPEAVDSYLRWGFFHSVLQRKEYFSDYVFEDTALELLREDPSLKSEFEQWKLDHPKEAQNRYAVLNFVYERSVYFEKEYLRYPIARIL
jgi:hypothetical protein